MSKKVIIVIVAAVLLLTVVPALAATPSKTTEDLTRIVSVVEQDGTKHNDLITIQDVPTEFGQSVIDGLLAYKTKNTDIVSYFDTEVKSQIQELLPQNTSTNGMVISELCSLCCGDHNHDHGLVVCEIEFPTLYTEKNLVVPLLAYPKADGTTAWLPVKGEVKNGHVVINFTEEVLSLVGHDFVLAILSK